jgi:hypothetical protein
MRSAIMASGARRRSAVELLIERLVPFEQRPAARPIVQSIARRRLSPFVFLHVLGQAAAGSGHGIVDERASLSILPQSAEGSQVPSTDVAPSQMALAEVDARRLALDAAENFLHSSELPDRGSPIGQRRGRSLPESHPPDSDRQVIVPGQGWRPAHSCASGDGDACEALLGSGTRRLPAS